MQDKQVASVYRSKNYDRYKSNKLNRDLKPAHLKEIMESMKKYGYIKGKPIIVNEKNEIIDGHHKFFCAKELGIPFEVQVVKGMVEEDIVLANQGQLNWNKTDFTNYYAKIGNENYIALKNFMEKYPKYHITQALILLMNEPNAHPKTKVFQNGEFKIASVKKAEEYALKIEKLASVFPKAYHGKFISALICCETRCKDFVFNEFYEKLRKFPDKLTPSITTKSYLEKFEEIYNYHRPNKKKIKLTNLMAD